MDYPVDRSLITFGTGKLSLGKLLVQPLSPLSLSGLAQSSRRLLECAIARPLMPSQRKGTWNLADQPEFPFPEYAKVSQPRQ